MNCSSCEKRKDRIRKALNRKRRIQIQLSDGGIVRVDAKGEGVLCGGGWISPQKKCSSAKKKALAAKLKAKDPKALARAQKNLKRKQARRGKSAGLEDMSLEELFKEADRVGSKYQDETSTMEEQFTANKKARSVLKQEELAATAQGEIKRLQDLGAKAKSEADDRAKLEKLAKEAPKQVKSFKRAKKRMEERKAKRKAEKAKNALKTKLKGKRNAKNAIRRFKRKADAMGWSEAVRMDAIAYLLEHLDRGVACGGGWISHRKKCSKAKAAKTPKAAKERTVEKAKAAHKLSAEVARDRGKKARDIGPKVTPSFEGKLKELAQVGEGKAKSRISHPKRISSKGESYMTKQLASSWMQEHQGVQALAYSLDYGSPIKTGAYIGEAIVTRINKPSKTKKWGSVTVQSVKNPKEKENFEIPQLADRVRNNGNFEDRYGKERKKWEDSPQAKAVSDYFSKMKKRRKDSTDTAYYFMNPRTGQKRNTAKAAKTDAVKRTCKTPWSGTLRR